MALVGVEQVSKVFRVSPRLVQKFAEHEGMPREAHGKYDLAKCMYWFIRRLHRKACGCAGPCDGFEPNKRNMVNIRAERKKALAEVRDIAPELVGLDAEAIKERLADAVKQTYNDFELAREEE